jgi:uncharacterized repeat protein (TIGR02543 family)
MTKESALLQKNFTQKAVSISAAIVLALSSAFAVGSPANASEMAPIIEFDVNILADGLVHSERGERLEQYQVALNPLPLTRVLTTKRPGYSFGGWSYKVGDAAVTTLQTATTTTQRMTLYAVWNTNVVLNGNGSTSGEAPLTVYRFQQNLTLPGAGTLKRKEFNFAGWTSSPTPGPFVTTYRAAALENGNPTFYAAWSRTVTFKAGGGKGTVPSAATYTAGGDRLVLPTAASLTRAGYEFVGWSTTARGKTVKKINSFLPKKENTVLYAVWKKN